MLKVKFIPGRRYGRLTALAEADAMYWECRCDCGSLKTIYKHSIRRGLVKSCGCLRRETSRALGLALAVSVIRPGDVFGRLTVLSRAGQTYTCRCQCGTITTVWKYSLLKGATRSCGCIVREMKTTHGQAAPRTNEYHIWQGMIQRTTNPHHQYWPMYGGRGIGVCEDWKDFSAFFAALGKRPSRRHSLDRLDNLKGYEPGNVVWATPRQQNRNMRTNRWIEYNGQRLILTDWAVQTGINVATLRKRLRNGWTLEEAFTVEP
jgi:hypothetical protein